jgi:replicative DNA helicase
MRNDSTVTQMRVPPQFVEGERSVLGAILLDNDSIIRVSEVLCSDDFYADRNRQIFRVMQELSTQRNPIDWMTLTNALKKQALLESIGGHGYLADLSDAVPSAANVMHYAQIVKDKSILRRIISETTELQMHCYESQNDTEDIISRFQGAALDLGQRASQSGARLESFQEIVGPTVIGLKTAERSGIKTGLIDLDRMTGGFRKGDLVVICGRPSMGKTALAMTLAVNICGDYGVGIFSLEMTKEDLVTRVVAEEADVNLFDLRAGRLRRDQWEKVENAADRVRLYPIYVDDTSDIAPVQMRNRTMEASIRFGRELSVIIVDHIQLGRSDKRTDSIRERITEISRSLKILAKSLNCVVVVLSQLNRNLESRPIKDHGRRPELHDLKESGAIEENADVVIGLYRPEVYEDDVKWHGYAEAIILKQRNGPLGIVSLRWLEQTCVFKNALQPAVEAGYNMGEM